VGGPRVGGAFAAHCTGKRGRARGGHGNCVVVRLRDARAYDTTPACNIMVLDGARLGHECRPGERLKARTLRQSFTATLPREAPSPQRARTLQCHA